MNVKMPTFAQRLVRYIPVTASIEYQGAWLRNFPRLSPFHPFANGKPAIVFLFLLFEAFVAL